MGQVDPAQLTIHAVRAITAFNAHVKNEKLLQTGPLRDHFLAKVETTRDVQTASDNLAELIKLAQVPFVRIEEGSRQSLGKSGSITLQFVDALGKAVSMEGRTLVAAQLIGLGQSIDLTQGASLDASGRLSMKVVASQRGSFQVEVSFEGVNSSTSKVRTSSWLQVETQIEMQDFIYELTSDALPSSKSFKGKSWNYPADVSDLANQQ